MGRKKTKKADRGPLTTEAVAEWLRRHDIDRGIREVLLDVLYDYDRQAEQLQAMMLKFHQPEPLVRVGPDEYLCPACGHHIGALFDHCHWCGKRVRLEVRRVQQHE